MNVFKNRPWLVVLAVFIGALALPSAAAAVTVTLNARASVWTGRAVSLSGFVSPAQPEGTIVTIDAKPRAGGDWAPVTTATLDADSTFSASWKPALDPHGRVLLRADAPDEAGGVAYSPARPIMVNPRNRFHVPYKYTHYIVIVVHEYHLYYYEHGLLVRRFDVALGRPGFPTPIGTFHVYGKRKPAGGAEGACAMFYHQAGGIAIHGTDRPWLIGRATPRDFSHGCARMRNSQALWLYRRVPIGTTVRNYR